MKPHLLACLALSTAALAAAPAMTMAQDITTTTRTITHPDGTKVVIIHRGGNFGDGYYDANHNWVRVDAQGNVIVDHPNGSQTVTEANGTRVHTNASGDRTVQTNPDGSKVITETK